MPRNPSQGTSNILGTNPEHKRQEVALNTTLSAQTPLCLLPLLLQKFPWLQLGTIQLHLPVPPHFPAFSWILLLLQVKPSSVREPCFHAAPGPLIPSMAAVVYISFRPSLALSNWLSERSGCPTRVLEQEARAGSCSLVVSCSVLPEHFEHSRALISGTPRCSSGYTGLSTGNPRCSRGYGAFRGVLVNNFQVGTWCRDWRFVFLVAK